MARDVPLLYLRSNGICAFKADVTAFTYQHRDDINKSETLQILERDWNELKMDSWPYAAYVDSQRIINDAYRKQGNKYRRPCCTKEIIESQAKDEIGNCMNEGF